MTSFLRLLRLHGTYNHFGPSREDGDAGEPSRTTLLLGAVYSGVYGKLRVLIVFSLTSQLPATHLRQT